MQKSRTENIKQLHFLLNTIPWHTEQHGTPIQENAVLGPQHREAENKAYSCALSLPSYYQMIQSLNSTITSPEEFSSNPTAVIKQ